MGTARLLAVIVLSLTMLMPLVSAGADPMHLVLVIEHKQFKVNTTGKFTAYVYEKDKLTDADSSPQLKIGNHLFNSTKRSAGTYEGQFTVNASDVRHDDWFGDFAYLGTTTVTYGKANASDTVYDQAADYLTKLPVNIPVDTPPPKPAEGLRVRCTMKAVTGDYVLPGGTIAVEAQVTFDGNATDPDGFNFSAVYNPRGTGAQVDYPPATKTGLGRYECRYTVPTTNASTSVTIYGTANRGLSTMKGGVVGNLDFLNVIYHNIRKGPTETAFEVWVADPLGRAVGGAHLDLGFYTNTNSRSVKWVDCGTTSSNGKVDVTLQYPGDTRSITIQGFVNTSSVSQAFSNQKVTIVASTVTPSGTGFEVARNEPARIYPTGEAFQMEFISFNNSAPWAQKTVYAYITYADRASFGEVSAPYSHEARTIQTGPAGTFNMRFSAMSAETDIAITFKSATGPYGSQSGYYSSTDGLVYSAATQYTETFKGSPNQASVELTVEKLNLGSPSSVKVAARPGDQPVVMAGWSMDQAWGVDGAAGTEWQQWVTIETYLKKSGDHYTGRVFLPGFLPRDKTYSVDAATSSGQGMASYKPGQGAGSVKAGSGGIPWPYIILIVVLAVIAAAVVLLLRRRKAPAPPSDAVGLAGAPPVSQPPAAPPPPPPPPGAPPAQYPPQPAPQWAPPAGVQGAPGPQPAPQQYPPQPAYMAAPPPSGQLPPPSRLGKVTMPNNAICGFCNQWLLQGSTGIMCQCGKYYHEHCAKIQEKCTSCGTKLAI